MVLLLEKLFHSKKFPSKLENHHHHSHNAYEASQEASLRAFRSYVSVSKLKLGSDFVSLSWIRNGFDYLFTLNKAFAKLVAEIDYPMSKWEVPLIEEYLSYSLRLLDLLNSVKSALSHAGQARFSMSLSLIESSDPSAFHRLRSTEFKNFEINLKLEKDVRERNFSGKDVVIHRALTEMKKNSGFVFGIILSSLSGDVKPYLELKESEESSKDFEGFVEKNTVLKEFKGINEAKACLVGAMEKGKISKNGDRDLKELEIKLDEIQKQLDDIGKKADDLFSEILAGRNEVLDVFRHRNQ